MMRVGASLVVLTFLFLSAISQADEPAAGGNPLQACFGAQIESPYDKKVCDSILQHALKLNELQERNLQDALTRQETAERYRAVGDDITNRVIQRQLVLNPIILSSVLVIVFFGLYLSYLQVSKGQAGGESSFEIGKEGFKIRSSVVGLLILCASLGFFYLYLTNVYRITVLGTVDDKASSTTSHPAAGKS
jgi:hypothetical protein